MATRTARLLLVAARATGAQVRVVTLAVLVVAAGGSSRQRGGSLVLVGALHGLSKGRLSGHVTHCLAPRQMADDAQQPLPEVTDPPPAEETAAPEAPAAAGAALNTAAADAQSVPPPSDAPAPALKEGEAAAQPPAPAPAPAPEPSAETDRSDESRRRNAGAARSRSRSPRGRSRSRSRSRSPPRRQRRGKASGWDVAEPPQVIVAPPASAHGAPSAVPGGPGGVTASVHSGAKLSKLTGAVQGKVGELVGSGKVTLDELDALVIQKLGGAKEEVALEALTQFGLSDLGKVKNKSGFLSSVIKRVDMERIAALSRGNPAMVHQHHAAMAQQQQGRQQQGGQAGYSPYGQPQQQQQQQVYPRYPGPAAPVAAGPYGALDPMVRAKLEEMTRMGVLAPTDLDARALETMREAGQAAALYALDRLAKSDVSHVRNRVGFLMSAWRLACCTCRL